MDYRRHGGLAALLLCLAACGAVLVPVWVTDLEQSHYYNYLYSGEDGETAYLVSVGFHKGALVVTKLDGDGQVAGEWEVNSTQLDLYAGGNLIELGGDRAMLVGRRPEELVLLDPLADSVELGLQGLQLADDEYLRISNTHLTSLGTLVFSGSLYKGADGEEEQFPASGIIDQERNLIQFQVDTNLSRKSLFYDGEYDGEEQRFVAVEYHGEGDAAEVVVQVLDETLALHSEQVMPFYIKVVDVIHGHIVGNALIDGTNTELAIALDGTTQYPVINGAYSGGRYPVAEGYYEVRTGYDSGTVVNVCFYDREFAQRWCRQAARPNRGLRLKSPRVTDTGDIAFTTDTHMERVMGVGISVEELADALQAGLEVRGEVSDTVTHYVYSQAGKLVTSFSEPEFSYRGHMDFCSIFDFCIAEDEVTPGVCSSSAALHRHGNQMISAAGYCTNGSGNWDRRVSLWQW